MKYFLNETNDFIKDKILDYPLTFLNKDDGEIYFLNRAVTNYIPSLTNDEQKLLFEAASCEYTQLTDGSYYLDSVPENFKLTKPDDMSDTEWDDLVSKMTEIKVPEGVTNIDNFSYNSYLTSVELPTTLTHINESAFEYNRNLENINIPKSVEFIGANAFAYSGIKSVDIDGENLKNIGNYSFHQSQVERVNIGEGVERIEERAFYNCKTLGHLILPKSLKYIGKDAFSGCVVLGDIIYNGSQEDWNKVVKGSNYNGSVNYDQWGNDSVMCLRGGNFEYISF